jgi:hypothetical protein
VALALAVADGAAGAAGGAGGDWAKAVAASTIEQMQRGNVFIFIL